MFDNIYKTIQNGNAVINNIVWRTPILCLIMFTGFFYIFKTRSFQITHFPHVIKNTMNSIVLRVINQ